MHRASKSVVGATRAIAVTLILAVATAATPALAVEPQPAPAPPSALRQSIDRAVTSADPLQGGAVADHVRLQTAPAAAATGSGGGGRLILTVLTLAVSVGTTYYMMKWMEKQRDEQQGR
jgi:hypothetical protein